MKAIGLIMSGFDIAEDSIAVIGMSCRFPGASKYSQFWDNLVNGVVSISFFEDAELTAEGIDSRLMTDPKYVKAGYVIDDIAGFDASFFGYAGSEAQSIDPQQRIFLECAWEALEDAGYPPLEAEKGGRSVGVFAGSHMSTYFYRIFKGLKPGGSAEAFRALVGNDKDYLCSRVSYKLNLHGPSYSVQSACSSSLVSVHMACESLRSGACDMAIAGGSAINIPQRAGYLYQEGMIMSPDGYCRPFDAAASGTVFSNGVGTVLLKRTADALADGDHIYAVVCGSAINNDGSERVGYTAPGEKGQSSVIQEALSVSGIDAAEIGFIEAHGTGTAIGDPIEVHSLKRVFERSTSTSCGQCAIGSVKANIGHADTAAGIASFIKAVLSIYHGKIPPHPLFKNPNPELGLEESPFYVNTEVQEWKTTGSRTAGVSSFGIGGSNAHVIIRQAPSSAPRQCRDASGDLFVLSSRTEEMLRQYAGKMAEALENTDLFLADVCHTVRVSRANDPWRLAVRASSMQELSSALKFFSEGNMDPHLAYAFCGDGSFMHGQADATARSYLRSEAGALRKLTENAVSSGCLKVALPTTPFQRKKYWKEAVPASEGMLVPGLEPIEHAVWKGRFRTPSGQVICLGVLHAPLLALLREHRVGNWGIAPASLVFELISAGAGYEFGSHFSIRGLSIGEPLPVDEAAEIHLQLLLTERSGHFAAELYYEEMTKSGLWRCVAKAEVSAEDPSGQTDAPAFDLKELDENVLPSDLYKEFSRLGFDYGSHFRCVREIRKNASKVAVKVISTDTEADGTFIWPPALLDGCLQSSMALLLGQSSNDRTIFIPSMAERIVLLRKPACAVWACARCQSQENFSAEQITLDISLYAENGLLLGSIDGLTLVSADRATLLRRKERYCYENAWINLGEADICHVLDTNSRWLIIAGKSGQADELAELIRSKGADCILFRYGNEGELSSVLDTIAQSEHSWHVIHMSGLDVAGNMGFDVAYRCTVYSLLHVARKLWNDLSAGKISLSVITRHACSCTPGEDTEPFQALLWGMLPVLDFELFGNADVRALDIDGMVSGTEQLLGELACLRRETRVALRSGRLFAPRIRRLETLPQRPDGKALVLTQDGIGLDHLRLEETSRTAPGEGQVEVEIAASSLNFRDVMMAMGIYPGEATELGSDAAGRISAIGPGVSGLQEGDPVAVSAYGCFRSHITVDVRAVRKITSSLTLPQAAAIPVAYNTAWYSLVELAGVDAGKTVLIHAASGGVGQAAVSICMARGARVLATAGSPEKRETVRKLGAELVMDSRSTEFEAQVMTATTGRGVDIVLNTLSGPAQESSWRIVADGGVFIELGKTGILKENRITNGLGTASYHAVDLYALSHENPEILEAVFSKVMRDCCEGKYTLPSVTTFSINNFVEAFRFMMAARHIGKVVLIWPDVSCAKSHIRGTELISGGLGGLGMELLERRFAAGTRHFLIAACHEPVAPEEIRLEKARKGGAEIRLIKADISDYAALKSAYDDAMDGMPPLRSVFHLAGISDDDWIVRLDEVRFGKVLAPKVEGVWNLHVLTRNMPLDDFVMFSSTASDFGTPGQAAYASANAFLDAFGRWRRMRGLPATVVNWGAWAEAGMVSRRNIAENLRRFGINGFSLTNGFSLLERIMKSGRGRVIATDVDWQVLAKAYGDKKFPVYFSEIQPSTQSVHNENLTEDGLEGEELRSRVMLHLSEKIAGILKINAAELPPDANLIQMGIDSLLALDLFQYVEKEFGVRLERSALFDNPNLDLLVSRICEAVEEKNGHPDKEDTAEIVPDREHCGDPFKLVDMQQAYWIGRTGAVELGNVSCHLYLEMETSGLDLERYKAAWNKVIARHGMLRAIIQPDGDQRILEFVPPLDIKVHDFAGLSKIQGESGAKAVRDAMSHEVLPSDLWPLFKVEVSLLPGGINRIHMGLDLIIADLHSMNIILGDLARAYADSDAELPTLNLSFRDYVIRLENSRSGERWRKDREYWINRLDEVVPAPALPLALDPSRINRPHFSRLAAKLDAESWIKLKAKAAAEDLTASGILLAAYAEILAAWSSSPSFTINVTLFKRMPWHPEVMDIVGDFTTDSLLFIRHSCDASFRDRAKKIQQQLWADMDHDSYSGVDMAREWSRQTGGNSARITPVVFTSTLGMGGEKETHPDLNRFGRVVFNITQTPQVWIDYQVRETDGELDFNWDYVDGLFPDGVVEAMFSSYCRLLKLLVEDSRIWQREYLPLLPADQVEKRRLFNAADQIPPPGTLYDLFADAVTAWPDQASVITSERSFSYRDMGRMCESVTKSLEAAGASHGDIIAVVMDGGWEERLAAVAAQGAGCSYMPIDAGVPAERLRYLLEHSGAEYVLTQENHMRLPWPAGIKVLNINESASSGIGELDVARRLALPEDLAYIIHTSGSTGNPKGVMIRHDRAMNTISAVNAMAHMENRDRVLALSRFTFDLSVWDTFGLFACGGAMVLPESERRLDVAYWIELMRTNGVTIWNTVPSLMQLLAEYLERHHDCTRLGLRFAMLSGDWIPLSLPPRLKAVLPDTELYSLGGATEASIWSNYYHVQEVSPEWKSIPYGKPLPRQSFFILNSEGQECPDWVPGQLYIGGHGLASGYLHEPGKTAEHFVLHPATGEELYATGDMGRFMADGNMEFLGRIDHQVKINGYRVELGEIESALLKHPEIRQAAVRTVGDEHALKGTEAFISCAEGASLSSQQVMQWLAQRIPQYVMPGAVYIRDNLPLNSSGKIDRKLLQADPDEIRPSEPLMPPQTEMEKTISSVLSEVMKRDEMNVDARFFEMGLTSLELVTVHGLLQERLQMQLSVVELLEHTTIRSLAACLSEKNSAQQQTHGRGENRAERRMQRRMHGQGH